MTQRRTTEEEEEEARRGYHTSAKVIIPGSGLYFPPVCLVHFLLAFRFSGRRWADWCSGGYLLGPGGMMRCSSKGPGDQ